MSQVSITLQLLGVATNGSVGGEAPCTGWGPAPLAVHVSAYRAQQGRVVAPAPLLGQPFQHFFVERVRDLSDAARRVRASTASELQLDFGESVPDYPTAGTFPANVFERILLGFRAVLHLQLGSVAK